MIGATRRLRPTSRDRRRMLDSRTLLYAALIRRQPLLLEIGPAAAGLGPFAGRKPCDRHDWLTV